MVVRIQYYNSIYDYELEDLITKERHVVWIGKDCLKGINRSNELNKAQRAQEVRICNTIVFEDCDLYQCSIEYDEANNVWTLKEGQYRTECPRGLLSNRSCACKSCMGRCVNTKTANPTYSWRKPSVPTLLNGKNILDGGVILKDYDLITIR